MKIWFPNTQRSSLEQNQSTQQIMQLRSGSNIIVRFVSKTENESDSHCVDQYMNKSKSLRNLNGQFLTTSITRASNEQVSCEPTVSQARYSAVESDVYHQPQSDLGSNETQDVPSNSRNRRINETATWNLERSVRKTKRNKRENDLFDEIVSMLLSLLETSASQHHTRHDESCVTATYRN